ncbi:MULTISPECIES: hypothetical protein [unclassified Streptomyces]|uniref:hypothetical protein n=1 Tax=unclassified Streptomyces TaxID=2593676 RepID=UPI0004C8EAAE|nr:MULTISPECIES: hypothetical protein [unclassified Streptomyces]KOX00270.1 hypothetical protein ADL02_03720 [Streptomyces sp. NRRL WC-3723]
MTQPYWPRLLACDLDASGRQYETTWAGLVAVLGQPAPYWLQAVRDRDAIAAWNAAQQSGPKAPAAKALTAPAVKASAPPSVRPSGQHPGAMAYRAPRRLYSNARSRP